MKKLNPHLPTSQLFYILVNKSVWDNFGGKRVHRISEASKGVQSREKFEKYFPSTLFISSLLW
jgi:hypothetical protein